MVGVCSYLLVNFWFTRIFANTSAMSAFFTNRVGDWILTVGMFSIAWTFGNLDFGSVFSLAPYINVNVITIIGICLLIGATAKSAQLGKLQAQKKVWCFILAFLSTLLIAGNISNTLESMHSKTLILSYLRITASNKKFIGRSRTRLLNTPIHIRRSKAFRKFIRFYAYMVTPRLYSTNITKTALSARGRTLSLVPWGNNLESTIAKDIRPEERAMQVFPREIRGVLVGLLLSDGSLDKSQRTSVNAVFRLKQSLTHSLFVWSVFNILSPYCYNYPFFTSLMSQERRNYNIQMYTRALPCFTELHNKFYVYNNGRYHKILPDNIYELMSLEALARWIMLAGNYRNCSSILISTHSYTIKEIVIILNVLIIKYSFECSIIIKKNKYHIIISGESFRALLSKLVMINGEDRISLGHELKQDKWTNKREELLKVPRSARPAADQPLGGRSFLKTITRLFPSYLKYSSSSRVVIRGARAKNLRGVRFSSSVASENVNLGYSKNLVEYLVGFTEAEGCFSVKARTGSNCFRFEFEIELHVDDLNILNFLQKNLGFGKVRVSENSARFSVETLEDNRKLIEIFRCRPLNSTKHLNFLDFQKAFFIYDNRKNGNKEEIKDQIEKIILGMNSKRKIFTMPSNHKPIITPYWFLGFIEGEGCFYIKENKNNKFGFGFNISQSVKDLFLMAEIKNYLEKLFELEIDKFVHISKYKRKTKNPNHSDGVKVEILSSNCIKKDLIPFLNSLTWQTKKSLDYQDWKSVLKLTEQGWHEDDEGVELINKIRNQMNNYRLSTNAAPKVDRNALYQEIDKFLSRESNYEERNGRIWIKSKNQVKNDNKKSVKVLLEDLEGNVKEIFDSITSCAIFLNVDPKTVKARIVKNKFFIFKNKAYFLKVYVGPVSFPGSPQGNGRGRMCNGNCILYKIFLGDSSHISRGLFAKKVRHERKRARHNTLRR